MKHKTLTAQVKALGDAAAASGQFEAYVSVFGNRDSYGDVVLPTAFDETLAEWKASGDPIPVVWSHRFGDAAAIIGHVVDVVADDHGLKVTGQLDLDGPDGIGETARMVHHLMGKRTLKQFSFTYDVGEGAWIESTEMQRGYYELRKVKLYEVGPCLIGANPETELLDVKALKALVEANPALGCEVDLDQLARAVAEMHGKAGRTLSAANEEKLRKAGEMLGEVLATVDAEGKSVKADDPQPAPDESTPPGADLVAAKSAADLLDAEALLADLAI